MLDDCKTTMKSRFFAQIIFLKIVLEIEYFAQVLIHSVL